MSKSALVIVLGMILFFLVHPVVGLILIFFGLFGVFINSLRKKSEEKEEQPIIIERIYLKG